MGALTQLGVSSPCGEERGDRKTRRLGFCAAVAPPRRATMQPLHGRCAQGSHCTRTNKERTLRAEIAASAIS